MFSPENEAWINALLKEEGLCYAPPFSLRNTSFILPER